MNKFETMAGSSSSEEENALQRKEERKVIAEDFKSWLDSNAVTIRKRDMPVDEAIERLSNEAEHARNLFATGGDITQQRLAMSYETMKSYLLTYPDKSEMLSAVIKKWESAL